MFLILMEIPLEAVYNCTVFSKFSFVENNSRKWSALRENQNKAQNKQTNKTTFMVNMNEKYGIWFPQLEMKNIISKNVSDWCCS